MITLDIEQGTPEWFDARRGVPTASEFSSIITPKTGVLSASAESYIAALIAETVVDEDDWQGNQWTERGKLYEPEARGWYEFTTGNEVTQTGIVLNRGAGWSPDGLVGPGGLEIKCPKASTHVKWLLADQLPAEHKVQCHAAIVIGELEWLDFVSYHPDFRSLLVRVEPDEYTEKVRKALSLFLDALYDAKEKLGLIDHDFGSPFDAPEIQEEMNNGH